VLDDFANLYYMPADMIDDYFNVSHVLIEFSDAQSAEITKLQSDLKSKAITPAYYDKEIKRIRNQVKTNVRNLETGEHETDANGKPIEMSVQQVYDDMIARVSPTRYNTNTDANDTPVWKQPTTAAGKAINTPLDTQRTAFRDCIYMYNADPGMVNATAEYVIGMKESRMVESFTKASRDLYFDATKNMPTNVRGSMSNIVWSEHGAHIIMYTKNLSEYVYSGTASDINKNANEFLNQNTVSYHNKTLFDTILAEITLGDYSDYERGIVTKFKLNLAKKGESITIYNGNIKGIIE
jgi:hypothetical protein